MDIPANYRRDYEEILEQWRKITKEIGADICGMTLEDIEDMPEVFAMPDGKYLIVEG